MGNETKLRLNYIDCLRGFTIFLVVFGHMMRGVYNAGVQSYYFKYIDAIIYSFHMPLMFFISGYVNSFSKKAVSLRISIINSILQLYVPYIFFSYALWFIKYFIFSGNTPEELKTVFEIPYIGYDLYWFLMALMSIKVVKILWSGLREKIKYMNSDIIETIFWFILSFIVFYLLNQDFHINSFFIWLSWGLIYHLGELFGKYKLFEIIKYKNLCIISLICIVIGIVSSHRIIFDLRVIWLSYSKFFIGIGSSILLFLIFKICNVNNRFLIYLGKYSMVIYLLHYPINGMIRTCLIKLGIINFSLLSLIGAFLGVLIPLLLFEVIKLIHILSWIQYLVYPLKYKKIINRM